MTYRLRRRRRALALCAGFASVLLLGACTSSGARREGPAPSVPASASTAPGAQTKPNIVFVLTDDLSWNLVSSMPHVEELQRDGTTFSDYFVTDSLCCPSRSSMFTGDYPHNTGVFTNNGDDGGYAAFNRNGDEKKCYAPAMQKAGYRTGFMGKYLNGYQPADTDGTGKPYVPPGWSEWDAAGNGYPEFDYDLNENGKVVHYGHEPSDYLTDVVGRKAKSFIDGAATDHKPFMLELATFAPHAPSTPAPRDAHLFPGIKAPRGPAYDTAPSPVPAWQRGLMPLSGKEQRSIDEKFAKRVRSVQAVDDMIAGVRAELTAKGLADNTYLVFTSDNGFHMGEHRLRPGKQTAYDTDIKVPLMVVGPQVPAGRTVSQLAENVDLSPTFQDLAGLGAPAVADGRSLAALLHGSSQVSGWRRAVLVEHHHPGSAKDDPDAAPANSGNPPTYEAIRTADAVWVEYADGEREYYDVASDPDELHNRAASLTAAQRTSLHSVLVALQHCAGAAACAKAAALSP
ncbi:sulfatase family protein [Actinacidiphila acidipaludis]|uniref:Sulfatase n=1 Tax=Actinacidiphila acidipaludis TaxID=2873382 RepID=A0ABS7Q2A2_9ACTN|nr:sulfatase [Streptomyces acidipaludis]MBY8877255.1 sulfatase [Streptomyces acidipaludis]